MFNFFKKKTDVLNHWVAFVDGFGMSPTEFYDQIEKELKARNIPQMEMKRIEFPEGGLLSEKRIYLRMLRERVVFDVCAAPFGSNFFFSCRTSEIPLKLEMIQVFGVLVLLILMLGGLVTILGTLKGILLTFGFVCLSVFVMRSVVKDGLQDLDRSFQQSPLVGSIYSVFFRKETYFRTDSRLCFIEAVPTIVKRLSEDATTAKGIRLVRQYEVAPVLGELYKRCAFASSGAPITIEDKVPAHTDLMPFSVEMPQSPTS